ncbi:nucleoside phosphorylase [Bradyrhizobium sp. USDA 4341]
MIKKFVDIGFIIPLQEEFASFERIFRRVQQHVEGVQFHTEVDLSESGLTGVAFLQDDMGKAANGRAADRMLCQYDVGLIIVLGIAGGLSSDLAIGDVCFTGAIIDVLENAKVSDEKGTAKSKFSSKFYTTDPRLSFSLKYARIGSDTKPDFERWQLEQYYDAAAKIPGAFIGKESVNETIRIPDIFEGNTACGSVSKSDIYNDDFRHIDRKILAIETESGGGFHSATLAHVPIVSIRGISDYADKNKNRFERETNGKAREIAALNAASFVKLQLRNPQFQQFLAGRRAAKSSVADTQQNSGDVEPILMAVKESIHQQLNQLSPEYRGKPLGYRLPLPRMRISSSTTHLSSTPADQEYYDPVSALEAITSHRLVITSVPRNYPDNSLPWIIAAELSRIKIGSKQVVPCVLRGSTLRPPEHTISSQCAQAERNALGRTDLKMIFIITDFPFDSRPRVDFLRKEIARYPEAHFVIVNKAERNLPSGIDGVLTLGAESFDVCDISFIEISEFLQRTFEMPDEEAGVVALRLQTMFRRFDLPAHPSYFAGVAGEVLTSLLRANRRAELLQLAVSGFLSFVVASDKDSVVLSRTTREEFLRQLAFEQKVNKRRFSQSSLVKFVRDFAASRDYEIDPISFVSAFQERGIIHFENDIAIISLPFIESYLLATELAKKPQEARKYFDLADENFDQTTFDIYAEIEPSAELVELVTNEADKMVRELGSEASGQTHILITNEIRPSILDKPGRLRALQDRLDRAFEDVRFNRPQSIEKQRILDIATRVDAEVRDERERALERIVGDESWSRLEHAARIWGVSIILLGSGSERLDKDAKRQLSLRIVQLTSRILDMILRSFPLVEFAALKEELTIERRVKEIFRVPDEEVPHVVELVRSMIDIFEFQTLNMPIRVFLDHLGNAAGQPVLRPSIASVESEHTIENLIARIWEAEIDAERGRSPLLGAIKQLPPNGFLRCTISTFFMTRVYWNHWEQKKRLALLDAAAECLKPFGGQAIDRGRLMRIIQKDDQAKSQGD